MITTPTPSTARRRHCSIEQRRAKTQNGSSFTLLTDLRPETKTILHELTVNMHTKYSARVLYVVLHVVQYFCFFKRKSEFHLPSRMKSIYEDITISTGITKIITNQVVSLYDSPERVRNVPLKHYLLTHGRP